jgi:uncharacterized protein YidB (DUF937 family)
MLDNLINLVKEHAGDAIVNNPAIPNEKNDDAIKTTGESILNSLKSQASGGDLSSLMNMFKGGDAASSPVASAVQGNVASDLAKKFGLESGAAGNIASSLIPMVMNKFVNKTNDPNDSSFDLGDIMKNIGGVGGGGIGGMISNFLK